MPWPKGKSKPHTEEQKKKISEGVKRQHREGRVRSIGFTAEARAKGVLKNWKGEDASLKAKHQWVSLKKGRPSKCEMCATTKAKKFEWANVDHTYRRNLDDYIRMCTRCHRNYDYTVNMTSVKSNGH